LTLSSRPHEYIAPADNPRIHIPQALAIQPEYGQLAIFRRI
jgi:hypothetical protein